MYRILVSNELFRCYVRFDFFDFDTATLLRGFVSDAAFVPILRDASRNILLSLLFLWKFRCRVRFDFDSDFDAVAWLRFRCCGLFDPCFVTIPRSGRFRVTAAAAAANETFRDEVIKLELELYQSNRIVVLWQSNQTPTSK